MESIQVYLMEWYPAIDESPIKKISQNKPETISILNKNHHYKGRRQRTEAQSKRKEGGVRIRTGQWSITQEAKAIAWNIQKMHVKNNNYANMRDQPPTDAQLVNHLM